MALVSSGVIAHCGKYCKCYNGWVHCDHQEITDKRLVEIAKSLDPKKVMKLDLKDNNITDFQPKDFANFTNLENLDLTGNLLDKVPANISFFFAKYHAPYSLWKRAG